MIVNAVRTTDDARPCQTTSDLVGAFTPARPFSTAFGQQWSADWQQRQPSHRPHHSHPLALGHGHHACR